MTSALGLVCAALVLLGPAPRPGAVPAVPVQGRSVATPLAFPLVPATDVPNATGHVTLRRVWSPFGITVSADGRLVYDVVVVATLPPPTPGERYVAWLATPTLDRVQPLGVIVSDVPLTRRADWNQLLVVISRETAEPGERWTGPAVLFGRSRSALIRPLWGHSLFRRVPF